MDYSLVMEVENKVRQGVYPSIEETISINNIALEILEYYRLNEEQLDILKHILIISDILYNNTDRTLLPLEDGIYDALVEKYKMQRPFEVHAEPVVFQQTQPALVEEKTTELREPIIYLDKEMADESLFIKDYALLRQIPYYRFIPMPYYPIEQDFKINKINVNVPHKYPKLVGTLDKCKFTLIKEAADKGQEVLKDPTVKIFERDFIGMHIEQGYISPYDPIDLVCELKYDGVSIEAEVTNKIISARSRGDTDSDVAADYTSIFAGMEFPYAPKEMENEEPFGMKFEAIITKDNLERLNKLRGVQYINCRVAIIGLLNSSDAYKYRNFITLIPLATSLDMDRLVELEFMNKYYTMGEVNRYIVIHDTMVNAIYQVYKFVQEAQMVRALIPYMYDGVVVSYTDKTLRETLGRVGAINKFTTAIKFSPLKKQTVFTGYTFSIGQNGVVTPLLHYQPVEFYGSIHTKSSGHSYARFKELGLRMGDIINVEYTNDVMPYATKADVSANQHNPNPIILFPQNCPSCGNPLTFTGKSAICESRQCPERLYNRMANMVKILGIKDFSVERIKSLGIKSLSHLAEISQEECVKVLGEVNGKKLFNRIQETLYQKKLKDYIMVSSLGFENISNLTWKKIFAKLDFSEFCLDIVNQNYIALYDKLVKIKNIGPSTAETIITNCKYVDIREDLAFVMTLIEYGYIEKSFCPFEVQYRGIIRFSGIRDPELELALSQAGYDCSGTAGVTKKTDILIVPYAGYSSSKVSKLRPGAVIMPIDEARYRLLGTM